MTKPHINIISPALEKANNGNWQTAHRWAAFLHSRYRVTIAARWDEKRCDAMIALHARRSAASIAAYAAAFPSLPLLVVLTGTDLYRDILNDVVARRSLQMASQLVVLQADGLRQLDGTLRSKAHVIYQSAPLLKPARKSSRHFDVIMVGHMRDEKDPATYMRAAAQIKSGNIRLIHIGDALEPHLGTQAETTQDEHPNYHWLGSLPHAATRQRVKRSHLMVITSKMEGGANVIVEAITSGVPVLASNIPGNRGMLGERYPGFFPLGNSVKLAAMCDRAACDVLFYKELQSQCDDRLALFTSEREKAAVLSLVDAALSNEGVS